jgi:hypothetical protein
VQAVAALPGASFLSIKENILAVLGITRSKGGPPTQVESTQLIARTAPLPLGDNELHAAGGAGADRVVDLSASVALVPCSSLEECATEAATDESRKRPVRLGDAVTAAAAEGSSGTQQMLRGHAPNLLETSSGTPCSGTDTLEACLPVAPNLAHGDPVATPTACDPETHAMPFLVQVDSFTNLSVDAASGPRIALQSTSGPSPTPDATGSARHTRSQVVPVCPMLPQPALATATPASHALLGAAAASHPSAAASHIRETDGQEANVNACLSGDWAHGASPGSSIALDELSGSLSASAPSSVGTVIHDVHAAEFKTMRGHSGLGQEEPVRQSWPQQELAAKREGPFETQALPLATPRPDLSARQHFLMTPLEHVVDTAVAPVAKHRLTLREQAEVRLLFLSAWSVLLRPLQHALQHDTSL